MKNYSIIVLIILSAFVLSGCGDKCPEDIDDNNDCTEDYCSSNTNYQVLHVQYTTCHVGNNICEDGSLGTEDKGENKCNAPKDCGKCEGKAGAYLEYGCEDDICDIDLLQFSEKEYTQNQEYEEFQIKNKLVLNQPFNVNRHELRLDFELAYKREDVHNVMIDEIRVFVDDVKITEYSAKKNLWRLYDVASVTLPLNKKFESEETQKDVKIVVNYYYRIRGVENAIKGSYEMNYSDLTFVKPRRELQCNPKDCDDNNSCTKDSCLPGTLLCSHKRLPICHQNNGVCDDGTLGTLSRGENRCNAPNDCGPCEGEASKYLVFSCYEGECVKKLGIEKSKNSQTNEFVDDDRIIKLYFKFSYPVPFEQNKDNFTLHMELSDASISTLASEVRITEIQLFTGSMLIYDKKYDLLSSPGIDFDDGILFNINPEFPYEIYGEEMRDLTLKIKHSYTINVGGSLDVVTDFYEGTFKDVIIVNPDI